MSQIEKGCIVRSKSGRDSGRLFVVLETSSNEAVIVDGQLRRIEKPKRKNIKHLDFVSDGKISRIYQKVKDGQRLENAEIKKTLNLFLTEEVL